MHFYLLSLNAGLGRSYWNEKKAIDEKNVKQKNKHTTE